MGKKDVLLKWFVDTQANNIPISGSVMLDKAKDFAFLLDFPDLCPANGWLHPFKVQCGIVFKFFSSEAASANDQAIATWLETNRAIISNYAEQDVYNADITVLFYHKLPDKTYTLKGDMHWQETQ